MVIGALVITSEYGTSMISTSLTAMPRRGVLYAAKAVVLACVTFAVALDHVVRLVFRRPGGPRVHHAGASITSPDALRSVLLSAAFVTCFALLAFGLGAIIRYTAGAVTTLFGLVFLIPLLAQALPTNWFHDIARWLPGGGALDPIVATKRRPASLTCSARTGSSRSSPGTRRSPCVGAVLFLIATAAEREPKRAPVFSDEERRSEARATKRRGRKHGLRARGRERGKHGTRHPPGMT